MSVRPCWWTSSPNDAEPAGWPASSASVASPVEGCQSGRMGRPRKPLWPPGHRGFKSHTFRHLHDARVSRPGHRLFSRSLSRSRRRDRCRTGSADVGGIGKGNPDRFFMGPLGQTERVAGISLSRTNRVVGLSGDRKCPERFGRFPK